jgi:hypothetical protein
MALKHSRKLPDYRDPRARSKRAPEAARGPSEAVKGSPLKKKTARKPVTKWLAKTVKWNMHLSVLGQRLAEGRLNSSRIQAWLRGEYYPQVLPKENGKPRMVRFVPVKK